MSPTSLTLKWFRSRNIPIEVTERFIKFGKFGVRKDIFGGDCVAVTAKETINVQCGASQHHAEKIKKAMSLECVRQWLACPTRLFFIQTWKRRPAFKLNGQRKKIDQWSCRITTLVLLPSGTIEPREFILSSKATAEATPSRPD